MGITCVEALEGRLDEGGGRAPARRGSTRAESYPGPIRYNPSKHGATEPALKGKKGTENRRRSVDGKME